MVISNSLVPKLIELTQLFAPEHAYLVPRFQRNYSWEKDHVEEYWNDLTTNYNSWTSSRVGRIKYYFGSLMIVDIENEEFRWLIDGQQRVTTSIIFLTALRDYFFEVDSQTDVVNLESKIYYENNNGELIPRISLNRYNDPFFSSKIMEKKNISEKNQQMSRGISKDDKLLAGCYVQISNFILDNVDEEDKIFKSMNLDEKKAYLRGLFNHLLTQFQIIENVLPNKQRAYRIFETINNKGRNLNENDLVKNYLLEKIDDTKSKSETKELIAADDVWSDIQDILSNINVKTDVFLRYYLTAFTGKTPKDEVYKKISRLVTDKSSAEGFLTELKKYALLLKSIKNPSDSDWNSNRIVLDNLRGLASISDGATYPILLAGHKRLDVEPLHQLIDLVTRLHFRAKTVCGVSYTSIEELVVTICKQLVNNSSYSIPDIRKDILAWPKYPSDAIFEDKFKELEFKESRKAVYPLTEIEYSYRSGGKAQSSTMIVPDIQVEHIMPKSIDRKWRSELEKHPELDTDEKVNAYHKNNLNKLGNLTLLTPNSNIIVSDDEYDKKLNGNGSSYTGYKEEELKITNRLTQFTKWGENEIDSRQGIFWLEAKTIWDLKL
jgi:uncharacterized protein with ParB-like and HNH nuclease domain